MRFRQTASVEGTQPKQDSRWNIFSRLKFMFEKSTNLLEALDSPRLAETDIEIIARRMFEPKNLKKLGRKTVLTAVIERLDQTTQDNPLRRAFELSASSLGLKGALSLFAETGFSDSAFGFLVDSYGANAAYTIAWETLGAEKASGISERVLGPRLTGKLAAKASEAERRISAGLHGLQ